MQVLIRRVFQDGDLTEELLYASPDYDPAAGGTHRYYGAVARLPDWFDDNDDAVRADFGVGRCTGPHEGRLTVIVDAATPESIRMLLNDWRAHEEYDTLPAMLDELRYRSDREPYAALLAAIECALIGGE